MWSMRTPPHQWTVKAYQNLTILFAAASSGHDNVPQLHLCIRRVLPWPLGPSEIAHLNRMFIKIAELREAVVGINPGDFLVELTYHCTDSSYAFGLHARRLTMRIGPRVLRHDSSYECVPCKCKFPCTRDRVERAWLASFAARHMLPRVHGPTRGLSRRS